MSHRFISDIQPGEAVDNVYMINQALLRSTSKGDPYIAAYLSDRTGQLNSRMWQASEQLYTSLPKPGFVHVQGRSELYQNNLQIIVNKLSVVDASQVKLEDFLAKTEKDVPKMYEEIKQMLANIKNEQIKALLREFVGDKELMEDFCRAPAAIRMHHSYLGGLLEHTHNMLRVALAVLPYYPKVDGDLVMAGIFLHDLGKTEELSYSLAFEYTDAGQLMGHIVQTTLMLAKKAETVRARGQAINEDVINMLTHIVVAHHGKYEFGSPKLPATAEAFMVNYIDDLDAKINQVSDAIEAETSDENWTGWQRALETKLYRKKLSQ